MLDEAVDGRKQRRDHAHQCRDPSAVLWYQHLDPVVCTGRKKLPDTALGGVQTVMLHGRPCPKGRKMYAEIIAKAHTFNEGEDDERELFIHKVYVAFNAAQIDGLPEAEEIQIVEGAAQSFISATPRFASVETWQDIFLPRTTSPCPRSRAWRATTQPLSTNSDIERSREAA
jgi:hypothetical protein